MNRQPPGTRWLAIGATIALIAAIAFLILAEYVADDQTARLDFAALRWLDAHRTPALTLFFIGVSVLGSWPFVGAMTLALCVAGWRRSQRRAAATLLAAVSGVPLSIVVLKPFYARPRPSVVAHLELVDSGSFPSGHVIAATIFFGTIALIVARHTPRTPHRVLLASCALFVAAFVALSRMYLGVHYPSDVLGGVLVGTTWSLLIVLIVQVITKETP